MRRVLGFAAKALVSLGILALIAAKTDLVKLAALVGSIHASAIAAVLTLTLLQSVVTAYRWVLVMRGVGVPIGFWPALQALFVSLFLNQCLPSYVGGDAYRVYWLYRGGYRLALAARGVLIDRISAVIALVAMTGAGLPLLFERFHDTAVKTGLLVALGSGVAGAIAFFACDQLPHRWRRLRVIAELAALSATARRLLLTRASGLGVGLLAILVHALSAVIMFVFATDLKLSLSLVDCLLLMPPITLLAAVPISIAGWGVREGVVVGALAMIGIGTEPALALSVLLGFALLANGLIGALPLALGGDRFVPVRTRPAVALGTRPEAS